MLFEGIEKEKVIHAFVRDRFISDDIVLSDQHKLNTFLVLTIALKNTHRLEKNALVSRRNKVTIVNNAR